MPDSLSLGPLVLPTSLLMALASIGTAAVLAGWLGRRAGVDAEWVIWQGVLVGALAARLAFVLAYAGDYRDHPWQLIDIRDGGWNATAGIVAGAAFVLWRGWRQSALRRPVTSALAGGLLVLGLGLLVQAMPAAKEPALLALPLTSTQGEPVNLASFGGKPTVVNLWATWCPPCRREMPVLAQAQQDRPDVNFVFISQGETVAQVDGWIRRQGLKLDNVLIDETRSASEAWQQRGYPTTLFFDAGGTLIEVRVGELSRATLSARLARIAPSGADD